MSEISIQKPRNKDSFSLFRVLVGVFVGLVVLFYLFELFAPSPRREIACRIKCSVNLKSLGITMQIYASDYNDKYPVADRWCDLLIRHSKAEEKMFICPYAERGRCHYAINPNCEPNSPEDIVLLFETKGGWNQVGGLELLTTKNHKDKGCNILFNDGHVEFVKAEDITKLKWGTENKDSESIE